MRLTLLLAVSLYMTPMVSQAEHNPYCVSGANWAPNGVMEKLGLPGSATDLNGCQGYIWDVLQETNIANMIRPTRYWEYTGVHKIRMQGYDHVKDEIVDADAFSKWVRDNPGKIWLIGNEPNHTPQDGLKPAEYARMFHKYYDFIKVQGRDPTAKFASGACLALGEPNWINNVIRYWDECLAEYHKQFGTNMPIDIWCNHCYVHTGDLDPDHMIQVFFKPFREYVDRVEGGIYADQEIWCTEFGVGMWATPLHPDYVAEFILQLCPRLEKQYELGNGTHKRVVDRWFWFIGAYSKDMFHDSSLLGPDGKPTAPGKAYVRLARSYPNSVPPPPRTPRKPGRLIRSRFERGALPFRPIAGEWTIQDGTYKHTLPSAPKWGTHTHLPYWYTDFRIQCDVKIDRAENDQHWAGVYFRHGTIWKNGRQGYCAFIRKDGAVGLSSTKAGNVKIIEKASTDPSKFNRIGVSAVGPHIEVSLNDKTLITWDDPDRFRTEGLVSLSAGMTDCSFDNVEVINLAKSTQPAPASAR